MTMIWLTANYLAEQVRSRLRAAFGDDFERGALSLEWIVIAVLIVAAATGAAFALDTAITHEASKLP
jgi:hypothetical protein